VRIAKRVEQAIMMGKIEGSAIDSKTMMIDESEDNSEGGKCYLYDLAMSHCSINCSNVFSKIDISPPLDFVYQHLPDSKLVASTLLNHMQPLFLRGIIQTRCEYHCGFLGHFNWTVARISRIEIGWWWARNELSLWKMMSSAILSPEHPQIDNRSKMLGKAQILPEKLIQEWCWIVNHFVVDYCNCAFCFGVTSHPWTKHVFPLASCCFEIKRCFFQRVFW